MEYRVTKALADGLRGVCIGIANTIPGVSGGTIAVVVGVYDQLIVAVSKLVSERGSRRQHLIVLLPVFIGILVGIIGFARVIDYFLTANPDETVFFFIGLILGSAPFLYRKATAQRFTAWQLLAFFISFSLLVAMAFAERPAVTAPITELTLVSGLAVFTTGILSAATMVIPGVSGSFVLLLIGMYSTFIAAARDANLLVLGVFLTGAVSGIALAARLIAFLLQRFHGIAYSAIFGLVIGSVFMLWPEVSGDTGWPGVAIALICGAALAILLGSGRGEKLRTGPRAEDSDGA